MSKAADEAFELARERIAQAKREGWEKLELSGQELGDLEVLPEEIAGLTGLTSLFLERTKVRDVSPLSGLKGLTKLSLWRTQVNDLSALRGLTGLISLNLVGTQVSDVSSLSGLKGLTSLDLMNTYVSDVSPLSGLKGLTRLDLMHSEVSDVSPLSGLTGLDMLDLGGTRVSDVSPLSGLMGLTWLYLGGTEVSDVSPLSGLMRLSMLILGSTMVSDVSALSGLTALNILDLGGTGVSDVSALDRMRGLRFLDLSRTQVTRAGLERAVRGKPDLVPPESQNALAGPVGVNFRGCAAAEADPDLERIAEIKDDRERTLALFGYLGVEVGAGRGSAEVPARRPAPLEVEITDTAIVFAGAQGLPASDATTRAEMGWEALKEYRDNFASGFAIHNYQPLPRRLEDFDRAMGDKYDPRNVVRIWSQGQRIQQLAKDPDFLAMLPVGVPDDLKGFAAAIALYAERFPDVIAYRDDVSPDDRSPANVRAGAAEFKAIEAILSQMPEAELVVKEEYRAEVEAGTGQMADAEASKAVVVSTGELMRETADKAQQKRNRKLARMGGEVVEDFIVKPLGLPYHFARLIEKPMRALSERFPNRMGWAAQWYDLTFGRVEDRPEDGAL